MSTNFSSETMADPIQQAPAPSDATGSGTPIAFRILGPLEVWAADRELALSGPAQKQLLAFLLLHANRPVPSDVIGEALWGVDAEYTVKRLQMAITRLRKVLKPLTSADEPSLRTVPGGYLLAVAPGALDA